jgi:hypothetical protein
MRSAEEAKRVKARFFECVRKDPEISLEALSERFGVSRSQALTWAKEAGACGLEIVENSRLLCLKSEGERAMRKRFRKIAKEKEGKQ